jgi:hypothetical protein
MSILPKKFYAFPNVDKEFQEPIDEHNPANLAKSYRAIFCGSCSCGKSTTVQNLICQANPPFDRIVILHNDPNSQEYGLIDAEYIEELPPIEFWDKKKKNLLIIEDVDMKNMKKEQKSLLDRYFGSYSSHNNISIMLTSQTAFQVPPNIRRMASHVFLWKSPDLHSVSLLSSKFNLRKDDLARIFRHFEQHDSLMIDSTRKHKLYKNLFQPLYID